MNNDFFQRFATEWINARNNQDLDKILSHFADDFEMSSPYISLIAGEPSGMQMNKVHDNFFIGIIVRQHKKTSTVSNDRGY
jgi:hypothetical protein